ncbi:MAG TPA: SGNH/GDSL hydrolase family protein [Rhizomicrobium sp.]|nr:SGNH/GDSL hydrolase family protein [Rhizomicrobium sp.]
MKFRRVGAVLILLLGMAAPAGAAHRTPAETWLGTWGYPATPQPPGRPDPDTSPPNPPPPPVAASLLPVTDAAPTHVAIVPSNQTPDLDNVTVRQIVRVSVAGTKLRLRLSNEGGYDPLPLGTVHIAKAGEDGAVVPGTDHVVTFDGGQISVTLPQGAPYYSDPVDMKVDALEQLAVSIYVPGKLAKNYHSTWNYVSGFGNRTTETTLTDVRLIRSAAYVTQVEVVPTVARYAVVTLGDSITEGAMSSINAFKGWPDRLAERLAADPAGRRWSVVNAGIGGNRLLHNMAGPSAVARLDRDVFSVPGVKKIILLEGINDIGRPFQGGFAFEGPLSVDQLIAMDKQVIARAHALGVNVIGATLTPYEGAHYYDPKGEVMRTALNQWIRSGGAFDGVIDFDAVMRDPSHPVAIRQGFNKYDHLHPNDAGYAAMANAIDLKLITGKTSSGQEKRHEGSRSHRSNHRNAVAGGGGTTAR